MSSFLPPWMYQHDFLKTQFLICKTEVIIIHTSSGDNMSFGKRQTNSNLWPTMYKLWPQECDNLYFVLVSSPYDTNDVLASQDFVKK